MDQGSRKEKQISPQEKVNIFSYLTFVYSYDIFKKAYKEDLKEKDVYEVVGTYRSKKLGDQLEQKWNQIKSNNPDARLYGLLWACYGKSYMTLGLMQLVIKTAMLLLTPTALGKLVNYFSPNQMQMTKNDAIYYASILIGLNIANCIYAHNYIFQLTQLGMRARTALCSLVYRKCLRLSPSALAEFPAGKLVTFITKDAFALDLAIMFANDMWIGIVQTCILTYLMYVRLDVSTFAGIGFLLLMIPIQLLLGRLTSAMRIKSAKKTDERIQITKEVLSAIRIIKMYTWEVFFCKKISSSRKKEIRNLRKVFATKALSTSIGAFCSQLSFYLLLMCFIWLGNDVTAEIVYFTQACFFALRSTITISIPLGVMQLGELHATEKRIRKFLNAEELPSSAFTFSETIEPKIKMKNVAVDILKKSVLSDISLQLDKGLSIVSGPIGNGKSTFLKTILRDCPASSGDLHISGRISYASQEPWLFPGSVKQNILFGETFDETRYQQVLHVCALKLDLSSLATGDSTIVGNKGMNLSKGQQARISLARAVYKKSDIYLLDDCLASLDPKVQDQIFVDCIKNFIGDKLVVMVSHNSKFIKHADNLILLENGKLTSFLKPSELLENNISTYVEDEEENKKTITDDVDDSLKDNDDGDGMTEDTKLLKTVQSQRNIYYEENKVGVVAKDTYKDYMKFAGGYLIGIFLILLFIIAQAASSYNDKLVSNWVSIEEEVTEFKQNYTTNTTEFSDTMDRRNEILRNYSIMVFASTSLILIRIFVHLYFMTRGAINIHKLLVTKVVNAAMEFFDSHYIGNILNRFSKDLTTIDEYLPFITFECLRILCMLTGIISLIVYVNPSFIIPTVFVFITMYLIRKYYLPAGRSLKRLDSSTRSPVIGHLNTSLEGLTTIRAYGRQEILTNEFDKHQDLYTSAYHMSQIAMRAFGFSLDFLCTIFTAAIVVYFLIGDTGTSAGNVGLAITQAFLLTGLLQWGIRQWAELENQMTSTERVLEYTKATSEHTFGRTLTNWPSQGAITFENVSLTYKKGNETVLRNLTFEIGAKQKIGVVGRTGAGKSSIIASLFRLYPTDGSIYIDGENISTLSLDLLRSKISIIPQDPVLFTGTIRENIDPTNKYSDEQIWKVVETVGLKSVIKDIHSNVSESGTNYSSGQKQLLCLARAIIQNNVILILDEATANMDPETDSLIHDTIQKKFSQCTVLTISHRLVSVTRSDKIMVMDSGRLIEFDDPKVLIEDRNSRFYKMIEKSNLL